VAELPERLGTEVHAFVLMDDHDHLWVRCRRLDLSEKLRAGHFARVTLAAHFQRLLGA
jgi:hypothetical protein